MFATSVKDFFYKSASVVTAIMPKRYKLRSRELDFLVECCMYNYEGKDLSNTAALAQHMVDIKLFKKVSDTSLYKYKLSTKKWAKTGRGMFLLPLEFNIKKGQTLEYKMKIEMLDEFSHR